MSRQLLPLRKEEVLDHLKNILGNDFTISDEHLNKFMHQLKKLILRDERESGENKENVQDTSINRQCRCHITCSSSSSIDEHVSSSESSSGNVSSWDCVTETVAPSTKRKESNGPTSSFIKPWQLLPQTGPPRGSLKTDPVSLYQQYKQMWQQHRVPGEDDHAKLRWRIREKMLGQDPKPRPVSRTSTIRGRTHRS